jgi:putative peptide zinc metalloprotease protein
LLVVAAALLAAVPLPYRTMAQGVVWAPEESWVRAGTDGVVAQVLAESGEHVSAGTPLLRLEDPVLAARVHALAAELAEVGARYDAALAADRVAAAALRAEQSFARERLADATARAAELVVRSPTDGVLQLPRPSGDLPGSFVQRGEPLAYVTTPAALTVRVVVPQEDVDLVRQRAAGVQVRLVETLADARAAHVAREVPAATADLPSGALSLAGGGGVATDPRAADGQTSFQSLFLFDVALDSLPPTAARLGGRAYVRFDHGAEPLARRWFRRIRQLLLERFDV